MLVEIAAKTKAWEGIRHPRAYVARVALFDADSCNGQVRHARVIGPRGLLGQECWKVLVSMNPQERARCEIDCFRLANYCFLFFYVDILARSEWGQKLGVQCLTAAPVHAEQELLSVGAQRTTILVTLTTVLVKFDKNCR